MKYIRLRSLKPLEIARIFAKKKHPQEKVHTYVQIEKIYILGKIYLKLQNRL